MRAPPIQRRAPAAATTLAAGLVAAALTGCSVSSAEEPQAPGSSPASQTVAQPPPPAAPVRLEVRTAKLALTDRRRSLTDRAGRTSARRLTTIVRYPRRSDGSAGGPYPLVVFGHGYAQMPSRYARLLRAWTRAGYVVAAPVFPGESPENPTGPDQRDLVNQPADVRFVVTRLLRSSRASGGRLSGLIDAERIAVAGHSDGGATALAVAYDERYRDRRVRAAVVLAGAQIPGPAFVFPHPAPALLAVQGGADGINPPAATDAYYTRASRLKLRLFLRGGDHFGPYTGQPPYGRIVERVTIAFLDRYVGGERVSLRRIAALGRRRGLSELRVNR